MPRRGSNQSLIIRGWTDCGFPGESPVDIHPIPEMAGRPGLQAVDGQTYLGIVARSNATWEAVSQKLCRPLEPNKCYLFKASLAIVDSSISRNKRSPEHLESYPIALQIWGGSDDCNRGQLLGKSLPVNNFNWQENSFIFKPTATWDYILIEAFYYFPSNITEDEKVAYNGHILVDDLSPIIQISCEK